MRAIVTGAAGFIGSALVARLLGDGVEVTGIDSMTAYYDPALKHRNLDRVGGEGFTHLELDLASDDLAPAFADHDLVFHLAGQPGVTGSWGAAFEVYVRQNVLATQRVLDAALRSGAKRVVYASSSSVYGNQAVYPSTEDASPRPFSPYGVTKLAAEQLCAAYAENFGLATASLRLFTVYGPSQRPDMAFARFISAALHGHEVTIRGDGRQVRDFTYVDDVVDAFVRASSSAVEPGMALNVSGGSAATVLDVLDVLESECGPLTVGRADPVPGDVARTEGANGRAREALGWVPRVPLVEGLSRQIDRARQEHR